jgi:hypothetical protein
MGRREEGGGRREEDRKETDLLESIIELNKINFGEINFAGVIDKAKK